MNTNKMNTKLVMNWYSRNTSTVDLAFLENSLTIMEINSKIENPLMEILDSKNPLIEFHYWKLTFAP